MLYCALGFVIGATQPGTPSPDKAAPAREVNPGESPFAPAVLKAAAEYKRFKRVSDVPNWSMVLCHIPSAVGARESSSKDAESHGRKLYYLYAKFGQEYVDESERMVKERLHAEAAQVQDRPKPWVNPTGQVLIKESFLPVAVPEGEEPKFNQEWKQTEPGVGYSKHAYPIEYAQREDGKFFRIGEPVGLFIMLKLDSKTPDTDEGWVYATTTIDGKTISSIGRVESCMSCHKEVTRDRVYGTTWSWPYDSKAKQHVHPTRDNEERCRKQDAEDRAKREAERKEREKASPDKRKPGG